MKTPTASNLTTEIENNLIKEAYAATLDPSRLTEFETFWEAYIDAQIQNSPDGFDWENTPVNAHIALAIDIIGKVRTINDKLEQAQDLVESHYGFGFITDEDGRIIVSNTDARRFTSKANHLSDLAIDAISINNILDWIKEDENPYIFFHVYFGSKPKATPLFIAPIKITSSEDLKAKKHFLITTVESNLSSVAARVIGNSFGLTEAETQVAALLAKGFTPKEVAASREVKITAIRTQIVNIKEKVGAKDIPDIVRIFISMGLRQGAVKTQIGRMEAIRGLNRPTIREASFTLRDGRKMQYFEQGHPKGRILLQIHSLISGVEFSDNISQHLVRAGYRMISPSRAGFGKSEPNRKSSIIDVVDSCVLDIIDLLDHLGATSVDVLAGWSGAIAQRLALKDKDRISSLVLSGAVPVWEPHYLETLARRDRIAVKTSIHAPEALPYLVRVRKTMKDVEHRSVFMGSLDKLDDKKKKDLSYDGEQLYRKRFDHILNQGIWAFTEDLPYIHKDWSDDARKLNLPVTIIKSVENTDQPLNAIKRYTKVVPDAKVSMITKTGTYQNSAYFKEVLRIIDDGHRSLLAKHRARRIEAPQNGNE